MKSKSTKKSQSKKSPAPEGAPEKEAYVRRARRIEGQVQAILDRAAASDPQFKGTVRTTLVRDPFEIGQDAPIVQLLKEKIQSAIGRTPTIYGDTPWMDTAILAQANIPAVIFGPTGAGAHAVEEWVDLRSVAQCADVLTATVAAFCN